MESQNNNSEIFNQLLERVNKKELNETWLKIRIDKKGDIDKILLEREIPLKNIKR